MILAALVLLAVGTFVLKVAGPAASAGRSLPVRARQIAHLIPAALLAALVANQTVATGTSIGFDARIVGVAAAAIAVVLRAPFAIVVVVGAGTTAATRALGLL